MLHRFRSKTFRRRQKRAAGTATRVPVLDLNEKGASTDQNTKCFSGLTHTSTRRRPTLEETHVYSATLLCLLLKTKNKTTEKKYWFDKNKKIKKEKHNTKDKEI